MKKVISICITSMLFLSAYSYADHPNYYAQQEAKQQARTTINMTPSKYSGFYTEENYYTKKETKEKPRSAINMTASKQSLFATQSLNQDSRVTNS